MSGLTFGFQIPNFTSAVPTQMFDGALAVRTAEANGFESVWVMDHFYQLPALGGGDAADARGLHVARRARRQHEPGATRHARHRRDLPQPRAARQGGDHTRRDQRRARDPRHRRRVARRRAHGIGFDFPPVKERLDRLEEAVQICRAMFTQETSSFDGRYYRMNEAHNIPTDQLRGASRSWSAGAARSAH